MPDDAPDAPAPAPLPPDSSSAQASGRRNSALVATGIFLSRIAGFARQRAIAHFFGVGPIVDAFTAALRIPNLMQNLLGEGVLSASFIPVHSRLLAEGREEEAGRVAGAVAGLLSVIAATIVVLGVVFAAPLTRVLAPGFDAETYELTVRLVRILTPGIGFLVLSAWCLGVLNSYRHFFLSYVAPVLWNIVQIAVLVGFGLSGMTDTDLIEALAWGAFAGSVLQFAVQLPGVLRLSRSLRLSLDTREPGVRRAARAFVPIVAGRGVVQLMTYVDIVLASLLAAGAVSVLGFAQQLFILPISLFGMSVAAAELPELSAAGPDARAVVARRLDGGLARIAFFVVPCIVVFFTLGDLVVGALYRSGEFGRQAVVLVWLVLAGYSIGLLANTSSRLLQSALYATGDARTPARVAALRVVLSAVVGAVLMLQFDRVQYEPGGLALVGDLPAFSPLPLAVRSAPGPLRLGALGLAVAAGISAWLEFALLRRAVRRLVGRDVRAGGGELRPILLAAAVAVVIALVVRWPLARIHPLLGAPVAVAVTGAAYLAVTRSLRVDEARAVVGALTRRVRR